MWSFEHSEQTNADPGAIWALWSDVGSWPAWNRAVESARLDGPFEAGGEGRLKPAGSREVRFRIAEAEPRRSFASETALPLAKMRFEYELSDRRLTHRAEIGGPLSFLFARVIGRDIERDLPDAVRSLARMAEQRGPA